DDGRTTTKTEEEEEGESRARYTIFNSVLLSKYDTAPYNSFTYQSVIFFLIYLKTSFVITL
ncbi:hypothetical protein, partial [Vibrio anguillarum]|uniref:hypothetical protein n=1 Tax=Vibrio anguillarum TaxID=55601 RepID=UPI001BE4E038